MSKDIFTYLFHKPYNVLSQFTKEHPHHITLADFLDVPIDVYPIGRLDKDSEGLLLLSNDKELVHRILEPSKNKYKKYLVQVEGQITKEAMVDLRNGVDIKIKKKLYHTLPAIVEHAADISFVEARNPPIRERKTVPTSWVEIKIREGKNRQVRKMFAKVGFPVLRLIRIEIGAYKLGKLKAGEYKLIV